MSELKIVFVGHVDHGKSTIIGRLLYDTKSLPQGVVDRVQKIADETGKDFEFAYLLDAFAEERQQGITIDTTQIKFATAKRNYLIIDAPGHKEFLKNMISGAANAAFLVIDAQSGVQEQSRRHAYLLSLLGIKKIFVLVNKMDLVNYSEARFNEVAADIKNFLATLNVTPEKIIPVSGFLGDNIISKSQNLLWYSGEIITHLTDMPPKISNRLRASVFWMGKNFLTTGKNYKLKLATAEVEATVEKIIRTVDASTLESKSPARELRLNDVGEIIFKLKNEIAFDEFGNF